MNKMNKIDNLVLKIGERAKKASLKVSLLSSKKKNDVLLDAADKIYKNKAFPNFTMY